MEVITTIKHDGSNVIWTLGPCSTATSYEDFTTYRERCCIPEGRYVLTCTNTKEPTGWHNGYIEVHGHTYCNDFWSHKSMQQIEVKGD